MIFAARPERRAPFVKTAFYAKCNHFIHTYMRVHAPPLVDTSSAFSSDLISTTAFKFIRPPNEEKAEDPEEVKRRKAMGEELNVRGRGCMHTIRR